MAAKSRRVCRTCGWRPVYAKGECQQCYGYRQRFGRQRPDEVILASFKRHNRKILGDGPEVVVAAPQPRIEALTRAEYVAARVDLPPALRCEEEGCDGGQYAAGLCKRHSDLAYARGLR